MASRGGGGKNEGPPASAGLTRFATERPAPSRLEPVVRDSRCYASVILIFCALAAAPFGTVTVSTPFFNAAFTLAASTGTGNLIERLNEPRVRSTMWHRPFSSHFLAASFVSV